jgi:hypothetical protein
MPTELILKQAFVWGVGIGAGAIAVAKGTEFTTGVVSKTVKKLKGRKSSKA